MIIRLNTASTVPIYVQLRNQIVTGIGRGELKVGEKLPTVRQLALDAGVNTMTVNKTYQIEIDRRNGATVRPMKDTTLQYREKLKEELELIGAEACLKGMDKKEFLTICEESFAHMEPAIEPS